METPLLIFAAVLLSLVGLMHSLLGGKRLIDPILRRDDLPIILGGIKNTRLTLWVGWHALTLFWWSQAAVLVAIAVSPGYAITAFLTALSLASGFTGLLALFLSRAKHKSWVMFLPLSAVTGYIALWG